MRWGLKEASTSWTGVWTTHTKAWSSSAEGEREKLVERRYRVSVESCDGILRNWAKMSHCKLLRREKHDQMCMSQIKIWWHQLHWNVTPLQGLVRTLRSHAINFRPHERTAKRIKWNWPIKWVIRRLQETFLLKHHVPYNVAKQGASVAGGVSHESDTLGYPIPETAVKAIFSEPSMDLEGICQLFFS